VPFEDFPHLFQACAALAARIIDEITPGRINVVRQAIRSVENCLSLSGAFQYLAILHENKVTGVREGRRDFVMQIKIRCRDSDDTKTGLPAHLPCNMLKKIAEETTPVTSAVNVTYNITKKPSSTIEAI
jgi:GMP synthase (glutamine-hydrolysing)